MKTFAMKFGKQAKGQTFVSVLIDGKLAVQDWAPTKMCSVFKKQMKQALLEHLREQKKAV